MNSHNRSLRTPLGKTLGLGSAKAGSHHWWLQRLTSIALILLTAYPIATFFIHAIYGGYAETLVWLHSPISAAAVIHFLGVGFHHAAAGLQVVIEDYVHGENIKVPSLILIKFIAVALTVIGSLAALKVMLGV